MCGARRRRGRRPSALVVMATWSNGLPPPARTVRLGSMDKPKDPEQELRSGLATVRRQFALMLMFFGAVGIVSWFMDRVFEHQRPTSLIGAFVLSPCLIVAGYLLDRGALRYLLSGGREPEPPNPPAP